MKKRFEMLGICSLLILLAVGMTTDTFAQGNVKVGGYDIDVKGGEPGIPPELEAVARGKDKMKWIVQFAGPIHEKQKQSLIDLGASVGDYLPEFAFIVTMDNQTRKKVEKLPFIHGVVRHKPAYKIARELKDESGGVALGKEKAKLLVRVDHSKVDLVRSAIQKGKGKVLEVRGDVLRVETAPAEIVGLARIEEVAWIEEAVPMEIKNDTTAWVLQSNRNDDTVIWGRGLHGEGQIVGVGDSGLDYDMPWFSDPDGKEIGPGHRKIIAYDTSFGDDYDADTPGHGTHVVGTLGGDRTPVDGLHGYNGIAPKARFFIQDLSPGSTRYVYPPSDLGHMFAAPYQAGARIHSNSWGGGGNSYGLSAATADHFMWEHKDFLVLFANGNAGPGANSVINPATAKNVISVGATLNGSGAENIASFSSNGLTADGRIKPTVCAPGDGVSEGAGVVSADSDGIKDSFNNGTITLRGTSMATPAVAGASALVRQYFTEGFYSGGTADPADAFIPSSALVKAMLINSAEEMSGAYTDGSRPATGQGWGRVNLSNVLLFPDDGESLEIIDESTGLATGQTWTRKIASSGETPLKVTLVWTDYPGAPGAGKALVNDLDLKVIGPNGMVFHGNVYTNGQSATGGNPDRLNVEEQVLIASPISGDYEIEVVGYNVPSGPQPFALVVTGSTNFRGFILLDRNAYNGDQPILITVKDRNLNLPEQARVLVQSDTEPFGEMVTLQETMQDSGTFTGTLLLGTGGAAAGNGILEISDGDTITATYNDADDGTGNPSVTSATARVDLVPPTISSVVVEAVGETSARITWETDEPADSAIEIGESGTGGAYESDPRLVLQHELDLISLREAEPHYFKVLSKDEAGNQALDDNGGSFYEFTTVNVPPRLTVNSSNGTDTVEHTTVINGTVEDPSGVASVTVNGSPAELTTSDGNYGLQSLPLLGQKSYELEVPLVTGTNTFVVVATDTLGNRQEETISVSRRNDYIISAAAGPGGEIVPGGDVKVSPGLGQSFQITAANGYELALVKVDGEAVWECDQWEEECRPPATYTFSNVRADHSIEAVFNAILTATAGPNGHIYPNTLSVALGATQTFTFFPHAGYQVADVLVDGISWGPVKKVTLSNITAPHTIRGTFKLNPTYTITASAAAGGSISPAGAVAVLGGLDQTFTSTAAPGYVLGALLIDGQPVLECDEGEENCRVPANYTFTAVDSDHTIEARFYPIVTVSRGPNGSFYPAGGAVPYGGSRTYTFYPVSGYKVADVKLDGVSVGAPGSYTLTNLTAPHTLAVTFELNAPHTITASTGPGGSISPAGAVAVTGGLDQTFTSTAAPGYELGALLIDGQPVLECDEGEENCQVPARYTFTAVDSDHTIEARFYPIVTVSRGPNGSFYPAGGAVPYGGIRTYTFYPASGYKVADVKLDGVSIGAPKSYTLTNVTTPHTLAVTFALDAAVGSGLIRLAWAGCDVYPAYSPGTADWAEWTIRQGGPTGPVVASGLGSGANWSGVDDISVPGSSTPYHVRVDWYFDDEEWEDQSIFPSVTVPAGGIIRLVY